MEVGYADRGAGKQTLLIMLLVLIPEDDFKALPEYILKHQTFQPQSFLSHGHLHSGLIVNSVYQ